MKETHKTLEFWDRPENKNFNLDKLPICSFANCNLALLISNQFNCSKCNSIFCSEHLSLYSHHCSSLQNNINQNNLEPEKIELPKCSLNKCNVKMDLCNRFNCPNCNKLYCMTHRHDFTHKC